MTTPISAPRILIPVTVTESMVASSTVPETPPAAYVGGTTYAIGDQASTGTAGGVITVWESLQASNTGHTPDSSPTWWKQLGTTYAAWSSGGSYTAGGYYLRATTHRVYRAVTTHSGVTTLPEIDTTNWQDYAPTSLYAPFDSYISTPATGVTSITYVLKPGFINAASLYGLVGGTLTYTYKDQTGGAVKASGSVSLVGRYTDEWDYCFGAARQRDRVVIDGLPPYPAAELTLTISGATGADVAIGMINLGDLRPLILADWGGTLYGAGVSPKTYSYIKTAEDGTVSIRRRHSGTDMSIDVIVPHEDADAALASLQEVLDVPCSVIATGASGYDSYNVFGLPSARRTAGNSRHSTFNIQVKGMI
jgi:hypothetical protein